MLQDRLSRRIAIGVTLLTALAAIVAVVLVVTGGEEEEPRPAAPVAAVRAVDYDQRFVERFDGPGYLAWAGAWQMPDGALMTSYTTATARDGDGTERAPVPGEVLDAFGFPSFPAERDFWGLDLSVRFQRSADGGETWEEVREDPFEALIPQAYSQQPTTALPDGTIIRRVNGDDLRQDPSIPHTAFLQRLRPGADEWGEPQVLMDPERFTYQITRIKQLGDGRLIATGNAWDVPASTRPADRSGTPSRFILLASDDDGATWREALTIPDGTEPLPGNEWDTAEMANGDLLAVMRTYAGPELDEPVLRSAILRQERDGWVLGDVRTPPFPVSGHPALLTTQEGPILSVATTGVQWTEDGRTWKPVEFAGEDGYRSHYYPVPIQADDGTIHVVSHFGADDPFGPGRHAIIDDVFRLEVDRTE